MFIVILWQQCLFHSCQNVRSGFLRGDYGKGKVDPNAVTHVRQGVEKQKASFYLTKAERSEKARQSSKSNSSTKCKEKGKVQIRNQSSNQTWKKQNSQSKTYHEGTGNRQEHEQEQTQTVAIAGQTMHTMTGQGVKGTQRLNTQTDDKTRIR